LTLEIWLIERLFFANNRLDRALDFASADAHKINSQSGSILHWQGRSDWYLQHARRPLLAGLALVVLTALASLAIDQREEIIAPRSHFSTFPLLHNGWIGREQGLGAEIEQSLQFSDYISADYVHSDQALPVNLYVAYYESQRKGASVHSPRSCIPADGWVIKSLDSVDLAEKSGFSPAHGQSAPIANRVVITRGDARNLVYYWFDQRGRVFSNEYLAKWYIFWDSLTRGRSDGALVRLVTPIAENEDMASAEARLLQFAKDIDPLWNAYLPD
jgi:EpsI family protein